MDVLEAFLEMLIFGPTYILQSLNNSSRFQSFLPLWIFVGSVDRESNLKARQCNKDTYKALGQNEHALSQGGWLQRICFNILDNDRENYKNIYNRIGNVHTFLSSISLPSKWQFDGHIMCEPPNNNLSRFEGTLTWEGRSYPLDNECILLRGTLILDLYKLLIGLIIKDA